MSMDFSNLPAPSSYDDWKSWASMLVQQLQNQGGGSALNLPLYTLDVSKERNGLPPAAKGDLIWLSDGGVRKLAVWNGTEWTKYSPTA